MNYTNVKSIPLRQKLSFSEIPLTILIIDKSAGKHISRKRVMILSILEIVVVKKNFRFLSTNIFLMVVVIFIAKIL